MKNLKYFIQFLAIIFLFFIYKILGLKYSSILSSKILIAEDVYYSGESEPKEFYVSILLNRSIGKNMIMYSTEGGMDIESVADKTPHLIFNEEIDSAMGLLPFQARKIAFNLGLKGKAFKSMIKFISNLYKAYVGSDATLFEINPVLKTADNNIIAVDAKVSIDDNALFRHPDYIELRDFEEENPVEVEADKAGLNYVDLDGNVGCMVNVAGLAMATMDLIKQSGGAPANFLDVGGTADAKRVELAFRLILKDPNVKAILVNIFAGIVSTLQNFLKVAELMEAHRIAGVSWGKLQRNIAIELALDPSRRVLQSDFLKLSRAEYDRLIEAGPIIDDGIIKQFNAKFKNYEVCKPS